MNKAKLFIELLIIVIVFTSCTTTDKVVSDHFIQKRKYNKGYFVNFREKGNKIKSTTIKNLKTIKNNQEISNSPIINKINNNSFQTINKEEECNNIDNSLIVSTNNKIITKQIIKIDNLIQTNNIKPLVKEFKEIKKSFNINLKTQKRNTIHTDIEKDKKNDFFILFMLLYFCLFLLIVTISIKTVLSPIFTLILLLLLLLLGTSKLILKIINSFKDSSTLLAVTLIILGLIEILLCISLIGVFCAITF